MRGVPGLADLTRVPAGLRLRRLVFGARLPAASLRGLDRFPELEQVTLVGPPSAADLERLATLPALRLVVVEGLKPTDAGPVDLLRPARPG